MSIITYPLNGITYDAENAETYLCTRTSGVFSAEDDFQATVTGDRVVTISAGIAWIRNADYHGKCVYNPEPVNVTVPIADGTNPRIDRIVLRFDKQANESTIERLEGTPAASPVAPDVTQTEELYELGLCTVYVGATAVSLSVANLTPTLTDESVCGLMRDGVTEIPTDRLYDQYMELITYFRGLLDDVKDETYVTVAQYRSVTEVTLTASGWTGTSAPYTQTVEIAGITDNTVLDVGIIYPDNVTWTNQKQISKNSAYIYEIDTEWDSVTFKASNKPTIDLTMGLKGAV